MKEQFVPYEQALELKELGFDEECLAIYTHNNEMYKVGTFFLHHPHSFTIEELIPQVQDIRDSTVYILAPLWQQAFDWFESKYNLSGELQKQAPYQNVTKPYWWYMIQDEKGEDLSDWQSRFNTILEKSKRGRKPNSKE